MNMKINSNKGELSLQVIVIAVVALLVLVVLTIIFASRMGMFGDGMKHCDTLCTSSTKECQDAGYPLAGYYGACKDANNEIKENGYCCKGG